VSELLTPAQVAREGLTDWRWVDDALRTRYLTGDFRRGMMLLRQIAEEAEQLDHHPDVDLRYPHLDLALSSHDVGGVTARDVRLARLVSEHARALGVEAAPARVQVLEVALDTADADEIRPFWLSVLGYERDAGDETELVDPAGRQPTLWLQGTDPHEEPRQRFHLDLMVPADVVRERMARALAAGGTLVTDEFAPQWWVLADPQGNKVCLCAVDETG